MQILKLPHIRKVRKCNKFCKSTNLRIFRGLGGDDSWKKIKQKILWHCPFKAKHQRAQECTDVTSQNFLKILSLETIPLKAITVSTKSPTPSYGVKEEICKRMPRNFFSSTQFQRKRKSLVFFQSINFLCYHTYTYPEALQHENLSGNPVFFINLYRYKIINFYCNFSEKGQDLKTSKNGWHTYSISWDPDRTSKM